MDKFKTDLAKIVQDQATVIKVAVHMQLGVPLEDIDIHTVTKLETVFRIKGREGLGPRYFCMKLSEQLLF